ncbi:hypothetical protein Tco_0747624 [Tanacetum coccineum]|uniref:Uncharacterized protein n=1 Tax=Tanacetum coccineum TaxID=301880 RepID=A0ABQ4YWR0_9ASTR
MEIEPDFENMTINEYLEYEAEMERRLRNVQSKRSPTKYEEDITVEDVERIRQFLTPNNPDVMDSVIQPLIPKTIHTTPPDNELWGSHDKATKSTLDDLLEEFKNKILNVTMVDEGAECNPTKDIEARRDPLIDFSLKTLSLILRRYRILQQGDGIRGLLDSFYVGNCADMQQVMA